MSTTRERLARCFCTVFPKLTSESAPGATTANVAEWDSLAMVTLLTVVQEEFGVRIPLDRLDHFRSFEAICGYLDSKTGDKP